MIDHVGSTCTCTRSLLWRIRKMWGWYKYSHSEHMQYPCRPVSSKILNTVKNLRESNSNEWLIACFLLGSPRRKPHARIQHWEYSPSCPITFSFWHLFSRVGPRLSNPFARACDCSLKLRPAPKPMSSSADDSTKAFMVLSLAQRTSFVYTRVISGSLSVIASAIILRKIFYRESCTTYHRIIVGLSVVDILFSLSVAFATLPVPADTGAVGAHGNITTCTIQGMFVELGFIIPVYMTSLSIYFFLSISSGQKDSERLVRKYEPILHAVPIFVSVGLTIAGLVLDVFNPVGFPELGCWMGDYPIGCTLSGSTPCRGHAMVNHFASMRWTFSLGPLFASFVVIVVANVWINKVIRHQDKQNKTYSVTSNAVSTHFLRDTDTTMQPHGDDSVTEPQSFRERFAATRSNSSSVRHREETSKVAKAAAFQSFLYVSAAFTPMFWQVVSWLCFQLQVDERVRYPINLTGNIIFPLQGVFNLLVYNRPRYLRYRKEQPEVSRCKVLLKSLCEAPWKRSHVLDQIWPHAWRGGFIIINAGATRMQEPSRISNETRPDCWCVLYPTFSWVVTVLIVRCNTSRRNTKEHDENALQHDTLTSLVVERTWQFRPSR